MSSCARILPANSGATCWWLTMNYALFHTRRAELDTYFAPASSASSAMQGISQLYDYYSGKSTQDYDVSGITALSETRRKASGMSELFNIQSKGVTTFDVTSDEMQDVTDYATKLLGIVGIQHTSIVVDPLASLYDITVGSEAYTKEPMHTVVITCDRGNTPNAPTNQSTRELRILERITVAIASGNRVLELDAIIVRPDFAHFVAYARCSDSLRWEFYGAMGGGVSSTTFASYEEMMSTKGSAIQQGAVLLIYGSPQVKQGQGQEQEKEQEGGMQLQRQSRTIVQELLATI